MGKASFTADRLLPFELRLALPLNEGWTSGGGATMSLSVQGEPNGGLISAATSLHVGDHVTFCSVACVVRGFTPGGVAPELVFLEDLETGVQLVVPVADLQLPAQP
jgi:hypothetical protein